MQTPGFPHSCFKIQMLVEAATRVKGSSTMRAGRIAFEIVADGKLSSACSAKNRFFIEPLFRPDGSIAAADSSVAFKTRKIFSAAMEADGDPVNFRMIMAAAGFGIDLEPGDGGTCIHGRHSF